MEKKLNCMRYDQDDDEDQESELQEKVKKKHKTTMLLSFC